MALSTEITTDAPLSEVLEVLSARKQIVNLSSDDDKEGIVRFGTPRGGYVTSRWDQKINLETGELCEDDYETWLDVYERTDEGAARRLFDVLASALSVRVTLFAPDSSNVVAESGT